MSRVAFAVCAAALIGLVAAACRTGAGVDEPEPGPALAEVYGEPIHQAEVDEWIRDELFRRESEGGNPAALYQMRAAALEQMIEERVLAHEAGDAGLDREELLERELAGSEPVSDADVEAWFEEHRERLGELPFEAAAPRIRRLLEAEREERAVNAIMERAGVVVHLEQPRFEVAAEGPARGPADAPVTIVEFSDFQCPYCRRALGALEHVLERYPDDVRLVYRHLPLDAIHPRARPAAQAAVCAEEQGRFWEYHDVLFENNEALGDEDLERYAREIGLDPERFERCLGAPSTRDRVEADASAAARHGIRGTPAFFVNGVLLSGAKPAEAFVALVEEELSRADAAR